MQLVVGFMSHVALTLNVYVRPLPAPERSLRSWWCVAAVEPDSESDAVAGLASLACCGPPAPMPTSGSLLVIAVIRSVWKSSAVPIAVTVYGWYLWFGGQSEFAPVSVMLRPLPQSND